MKNQDLISQIQQWFKLAVPAPTTKNKAVQIGFHLEEVAEMAEAITGGSNMLAGYLHRQANSFKKCAQPLNTRLVENIAENPERSLAMRDALCDQIVTAIGIYHMMGWDIQADLAEVNRSNWSKFENGQPVFDENGKIKKGAGYTPPALPAETKTIIVEIATDGTISAEEC